MRRQRRYTALQTNSVGDEGHVKLALDALLGLEVDLVVDTAVDLEELDDLVGGLGAAQDECYRMCIHVCTSLLASTCSM